MAQVLYDLAFSFGSCLNCFPGSPTLKINSRSFKILRLLGEGGFSYVYLVQDTTSGELFALKKIRCPFGAESVAQAMREVEAYRLFARAPGIIHSVDYSIAAERSAGSDPGAKTVYVLLPYYRRGNLQDLINANLVNHARFPERRLMQLMAGVCRALREMHTYRGGGGGGGSSSSKSGGERMEARPQGGADDGTGASGRTVSNTNTKVADEDDETAQEQPLMGDEGGGSRLADGGKAPQSYAHRDIKPGNIMIADNGNDPVLMDLGSVAASPLAITSRSLAIATQDTAAEHSTMPYRAPELFDVKTGAVIDTKVDIWSLGCTLYACLVGRSPFELRSDETGGSLSLCVLGGDWRFPDETPGGQKKSSGPGPNKGKGRAAAGAASGAEAGANGAASSAQDGDISEPVREIVRRCLRVEPSERPDIDELLAMVEKVIDELPEDGSASA